MRTPALFGIEVAADCFSERRVELGLLSERPDSAESKTWTHIRAPITGKHVQKTRQFVVVVAVIGKSLLLQTRPQVALYGLPGVATSDAIEPVFVLPAGYVVKRRDWRAHIQPSGRR